MWCRLHGCPEISTRRLHRLPAGVSPTFAMSLLPPRRDSPSAALDHLSLARLMFRCTRDAANFATFRHLPAFHGAECLGVDPRELGA